MGRICVLAEDDLRVPLPRGVLEGPPIREASMNEMGECTYQKLKG